MVNKYSAKLSGLKRTKWENKSPKQQAQYFMKVYQELGLAIPKYMLDGKMTAKQLTSNINKLTKSLQSRAKHETKRLRQERINQQKIKDDWTKVEKALNPINSNYVNKIESQAISNDEKLVFINGSEIVFKGGVDIVYPSIQTLSVDQLKTMYDKPKDALKFVNKSYKNQLESFDLTTEREKLKNKVINKTIEVGSQEQSLGVNDKEVQDAIKIVRMGDYPKLMRMVNYLDDHEYMSMVESLLRRGFVFVEALNIAFKNFVGVEL